MREFNINMEGYNVNGICPTCLSHGRRMICLSETPYYFQILANVEVPTGVTVQLCWECAALIKNIRDFSQQISNSYNILEEYSRENPYLNAPWDLTKHHSPRLSMSSVKITECAQPSVAEEAMTTLEDIKLETEEELKFEGFEFQVEKEELKQEDEYNYLDEDLELAAAAMDSPSDDEKLSELSARKVKVEKKRRKKRDKNKKAPSRDSLERRALKLKQYRRLWGLPGCLEPLALTEESLRVLRARDLEQPCMARARHACEHCIVAFNSRKLLEEHIEKKHAKRDDAPFECDVCRTFFLTPENLSVHRELHAAGYRCTECDLSSSSKYVIMRHVRERHARGAREDAHRCSVCDESFSSKSKLSYHRIVTHSEKPQCDCCGKVFANKITLKYHLKVLPQKKPDAEREKLQIQCKGCDKVFHSRKSYSAHRVIHDGLEYPCPVCGKLFQWKRNLARHLRNHREKDNGALYECRQCNKRFSSRDCYANHMKLSKRHVSEESYSHQCQQCGKRFPSRWALVDHVDWDHLKKIKYQCKHCLKAFKTAKIMVAHVNIIHENKRTNKDELGEHLCDICGKSYKSQKRLKGHVWSMHTHRSQAKSFKCKLCPATFTWQTSIYKHVKMMHGRDVKQPTVRLSRGKQQDLALSSELYQHAASGVSLPAILDGVAS